MNSYANCPEIVNPPVIVRKSEEACAKLIPIKSGERYQKQFSHFCEWKAENNVMKITEEVMLACFLDLPSRIKVHHVDIRGFHMTPILCKVQSGRYKITPKRDKPLTYEMANPPHYIAHRKSWNSWNTSNLVGGLRPAETVVEDLFIRRFMTGTWHSLFVSEVIIKRQHNLIRIAGIVRQAISSRKMYFLIGYCEELLSSWLQCPVKLELQTVADKKDVVFKYI